MEFGIIAFVMFMMVFAIFDLGRYAVTLHSLEMLAAESARQEIICYSRSLAGLPARVCPGDPLNVQAANSSARQLFPFLYLGGLTPTVTTTVNGGAHVVQASQDPKFSMIMPFWPRSMNTLVARTSLPF
jgi:hypothetical protein